MPANDTQRTRATVLAGLLLVLVAVVGFRFWFAASPAAAPSNQTRGQGKPVATTATGPSQLDVRLDDLKHAPPEPSEENRNPFRFYVKPPPPPPPVVAPPTRTIEQPVGPPPPPPGPPPPPPIPVKFIGIAEKAGKKYAIFSDGRGLPFWAGEGEMVMGQWKLVRIGVESVVMEYPDGRGRQTIPMRGQ